MEIFFEKYANFPELEPIFILKPLFEDYKVIPLGIYLMCFLGNPEREDELVR